VSKISKFTGFFGPSCNEINVILASAWRFDTTVECIQELGLSICARVSELSDSFARSWDVAFKDPQPCVNKIWLCSCHVVYTVNNSEVFQSSFKSGVLVGIELFDEFFGNIRQRDVVGLDSITSETVIFYSPRLAGPDLNDLAFH
jgi:hypothetical protein